PRAPCRVPPFPYTTLFRSVLVNAAASGLEGPVAGGDTEHWRRALAVNLMGVLYCTHAALPVMRAHGGGRIVNVACARDGASPLGDRKSTRLNSSHLGISYA